MPGILLAPGGPGGGASSAAELSLDDTGLVVAKGLNVHAALAALDVWTQAQPRHEGGLIAALPADGARPDGSTYLATDQNGGTPYRMIGGVWKQTGAGVNVSANLIAGPVSMTGAQSFDVKAVGAVATDVPGMSINVPASAKGVLLRHKWEVQCNSGTAANASSVRVTATITDNANAVIASGAFTAIQVGAAALVLSGQITLEVYLPGPVAAATYKLRAQTAAAVPANWTSALLMPANGNGGANSKDNLYALAIG